VNGKNPRQIALRVLQTRREGEYTEALLEQAFAGPAPQMSSLDKGLCQELVYGIVRRQATLDWLIARKTEGRQQNPGIQNLLRLGLYQIFWLDKIPPHAAVHETVELAKREGFGLKAGFINAVLRGYLREADATKKLLADLKTSDPALGFSHPQWLVEKWQKRFGEERARQLLEWNNTPPKTFARVNTLKVDAGKLIEKWREEDVEYDFVRNPFLLDAGMENISFELKSHPPLASLESFSNGWFYIQDPSTLLAPLELAPRPGETVLDLCAAPGGKTTFIAQLMKDEGKVVACDIAPERLKLVQENCERLGITCVETIPSPVLHPPSSGFDRILIDAPCSNTGVLRRRVDLRWRVSPEEILRLQKTQLDLLKSAALALTPGGVLVYSTCSLEPEENSVVVQEFLKAQKDFKLERERELLPFADQLDGAFVARLQKQVPSA
jgi:16S rRNA (cytosine967-C5)-methyltransferase